MGFQRCGATFGDIKRAPPAQVQPLRVESSEVLIHSETSFALADVIPGGAVFPGRPIRAR